MMATSSWAFADPEPSRDESEERTPGSPSNSWSSSETQPGPGGAESPIQDGDGARRPKRCKISREQLQVLIKSFEEEPLPNFDQRQALAKMLGMTPRSVQIWFQNRRQRLKPLQPKAASTATPLCGLQSAAMAARAAQASGGRTAQQQLGMPGLAAAAGLCSSAHGNIDQLMMSHALSQLPQQSPGPAYGHSLSAYGDVMEPFAATKALAAITGLSPEMRGRTPAGSCPPFALGGGAVAQTAPGAMASMIPRGSCPSPSAAAVAPKTEKADGLLLLLACADDNSTDGNSVE
mmetsp:Transcript_40202/g.106432  ORF Transcript_40202/g.106432 Transcript_40202/m.106432 type:complete len:291 (+) Transcript_40202:18-890(+)